MNLHSKSKIYHHVNIMLILCKGIIHWMNVWDNISLQTPESILTEEAKASSSFCDENDDVQ